MLSLQINPVEGIQAFAVVVRSIDSAVIVTGHHGLWPNHLVVGVDSESATRSSTPYLIHHVGMTRRRGEPWVNSLVALDCHSFRSVRSFFPRHTDAIPTTEGESDASENDRSMLKSQSDQYLDSQNSHQTVIITAVRRVSHFHIHLNEIHPKSPPHGPYFGHT